MQPTIVNNVESLSNVPWMINQGGQAFADIGVPTSTGMRMFAVSGHINRPGVFEVPQGVTTFRMLFEAPEYGDGIRDGRSVKAFIPGGASAPWFFEEHLDVPLDKPTVDKAGSMLVRGRSSSWTTGPTWWRRAGESCASSPTSCEVHAVP